MVQRRKEKSRPTKTTWMRCTDQERLQLGWKSWASATQRQQQETETGENRASEPYICASWH